MTLAKGHISFVKCHADSNHVHNKSNNFRIVVSDIIKF